MGVLGGPAILWHALFWVRTSTINKSTIVITPRTSGVYHFWPLDLVNGLSNAINKVLRRGKLQLQNDIT